MINTTFAYDWICVHNYKKDFLIFCSTIPSVKSFKRKIYLYLVKKDFFGMPTLFRMPKMDIGSYYLCRIPGKGWLR